MICFHENFYFNMWQEFSLFNLSTLKLVASCDGCHAWGRRCLFNLDHLVVLLDSFLFAVTHLGSVIIETRLQKSCHLSLFFTVIKFRSIKSSNTNIFSYFNFQTKSLSEIKPVRNFLFLIYCITFETCFNLNFALFWVAWQVLKIK